MEMICILVFLCGTLFICVLDMCFNNCRIHGLASKIDLSPLLALDAFKSVVDKSLFIVAPIFVGDLFDPCFAIQYFMS